MLVAPFTNIQQVNKNNEELKMGFHKTFDKRLNDIQNQNPHITPEENTLNYQINNNYSSNYALLDDNTMLSICSNPFNNDPKTGEPFKNDLKTWE